MLVFRVMHQSKREGFGLPGLRYRQAEVILYNMPHAVSRWRDDAGL
ncbi:MAG: hypothetical protein ABTQ25_01915 [Nitrosomonas ureae]